MKWPEVLLGSLIADTRNGLYKHADFYGHGTPILKMFNLQRGRLDLGRVDRVELEPEQLSAYRLQPGDILMNRVNTPELVGKCAVIPAGLGDAVFESKNIRIRLYEDVADPRFVASYLNSTLGRPSLCRGVKHAIGMATINGNDVRKCCVPLPAPKEQRWIVELLEQADGLRRQRAEADTLADRILPALFHKMFGDPASNPKGWPRVRLETLIADTRNGLYRHADFYGRGTQILKMFNILDGRLNLARVDRVELSADELAAYRLESGDILVNRVNTPELVGKCAVIPSDLGEAVFESKNIRLRLKSDVADPDFAAHFLNTSFGHATLCQGVKHAIGMATINNSDVRNCRLPLPPITEQRQWATQVTSIRRLTAQTHKSRVNLDQLFQVLLHHAFTGELTAKWREAHLKELLAEMEHQARLLRQAPPPT